MFDSIDFGLEFSSGGIYVGDYGVYIFNDGGKDEDID